MKSPEEHRPLRADAQRNRQTIIRAAIAVFAAEGTAVTLEHVASTAGVGVGTIYRRFQTIDALVAEALETKMADYADQAEAAAELSATDPEGALEQYIYFILEQQATDLAFSELILRPAGASNVFKSEIGRALNASIVLIDRAKESGAIRVDFDHSDLHLILNANAGIIRGMGRAAPSSWRRFAQYMLQAFRQPGQETLTPPPSSWVRAGNARRSRVSIVIGEGEVPQQPAKGLPR